MKKIIFTIISSAILLVFSLPSAAENLIEVYKQAQLNDPTFKAAEAQWLATQQLIPINRAALLPQITSTGTVSRQRINQTFIQDVTFYDTNSQFLLSLNQSVFNYQLWKLLATAKAQVKQAEANYNSATQSLMLRVATAYFNILQAYEKLQATEATKRSLAQQLRQTQEQYKVGLIAITGVEQVRASYDGVLAQEIADKNSVSDALEELRAITGVFYTYIDGGKTNMPLISPQPADINAWVRIAAKQNYAIKAAYYAMMASRENVKVQNGGHFPTVTANSNYSYVHDTAVNTFGSSVTPQTTKTATIGATVNFPIFQGGLVNAQTRQASYQYAQSSADMEQSYRSTLTQTRESYLGVMAGISKIKADRQTIRSNESSLAATKEGYTVGTQTIVDVLQQQSNLFQAQTNYASDQFNYLISILNLKQAAGTLSCGDMAAINSWLGKPIDFSRFNFNNGSLSFGPTPEEAKAGGYSDQPFNASEESSDTPPQADVTQKATPKKANKSAQNKTKNQKKSKSTKKSTNKSAKKSVRTTKTQQTVPVTQPIINPTTNNVQPLPVPTQPLPAPATTAPAATITTTTTTTHTNP